jgi:hypothetical protein
MARNCQPVSLSLSMRMESAPPLPKYPHPPHTSSFPVFTSGHPANSCGNRAKSTLTQVFCFEVGAKSSLFGVFTFAARVKSLGGRVKSSERGVMRWRGVLHRWVGVLVKWVGVLANLKIRLFWGLAWQWRVLRLALRTAAKGRCKWPLRQALSFWWPVLHYCSRLVLPHRLRCR